jgi:hypothetical protein
MTTLKVRTSTRDSITRAARANGLTVDKYLAHLQEEQLWRERLADARVAMAEPDPGYLEEIAVWDSLTISEGP